MLAGIKETGDDLVDGTLEYPLPFIQQRCSMWIDRPHPEDVLSGDLEHLSLTGPQFLCNRFVKNQASLLIASQRRSYSGVACQAD